MSAITAAIHYVWFHSCHTVWKYSGVHVTSHYYFVLCEHTCTSMYIALKNTLGSFPSSCLIVVMVTAGALLREVRSHAHSCRLIPYVRNHGN